MKTFIIGVNLYTRWFSLMGELFDKKFTGSLKKIFYL